VTVLLGLLAAICYGVGDFAGGIAARLRARPSSAVTVLLHSYPVGAVLMTVLLPAFPGTLTSRVVLFGALGGAAGLIGVTVMYQLMVTAPMNVVSPTTAVLSAIVPVIVAVGQGERPHGTAWTGMVLGLLAVALVSRTADDSPHGPLAPRVLPLAVLSGAGFGLYFVFLARAGHDSGLWPLVISRWMSAFLIIPLAISRTALARLTGRALAITLGAGALDASANMFFLLSARHGLLSLAAVLTSLYPAVTVLLAVGLLHEHTSVLQRCGLGLAAASIVLLTV
jgi:drug/metabolite transporter (DMT)-like permease